MSVFCVDLRALRMLVSFQFANTRQEWSVNIPYTGAYKSGAAEQFSKCGGRSISFEVLLGGIVGLWTSKVCRSSPCDCLEPFFSHYSRSLYAL